MKSSPQSWKNYEELARHVISYFADILGITTVEAKQRLQGQSGTEWEIDAKGVRADGRAFLVIECKERTCARLTQAVIGTLAFVVQDVGAQGAVLVTSTGLQEGAELVVKYCDFHVLYLPKESTFEDFVARCGNRVLHKLPPERVTASVSLAGIYYKPVNDAPKEGV